MDNKDLLKIKEDIKNILIENGTKCLCGHFEWCEGCSPSSYENRIFAKIMDYFDKLNG